MLPGRRLDDAPAEPVKGLCTDTFDTQLALQSLAQLMGGLVAVGKQENILRLCQAAFDEKCDVADHCACLACTAACQDQVVVFINDTRYALLHGQRLAFDIVEEILIGDQYLGNVCLANAFKPFSGCWMSSFILNSRS